MDSQRRSVVNVTLVTGNSAPGVTRYYIRMEAKVHQDLLSFLVKHNQEESVSNIDEIILSYLVGVVELISQGDDGLDIVELMEMMNAYLPGFDQINRSDVIDWMFGLASKLMGPNKESNQEICDEDGDLSQSDVCHGISDVTVGNQVLSGEQKGRKFPSYDFAEKSEIRVPNSICDPVQNGILNSKHRGESEEASTNKKADIQKVSGHSSGFTTSVSSSSSSSSSTTSIPSLAFPLCPPSETVSHPARQSKRKGRQLSCSSQDSQDDTSKVDSLENRESQVRTLLEMFPAACTMEARHCLQLSAGDMDRAAQLIIDRQETGQAITGQTKSKATKKNHKMKKTTDYKLDDDSIKSCVLEKYSFVDTEEDKKTYRPPPPKGEAKKLVRYRDGIVVSMKGERYSEVKQKEGDDLKSTYVNLKPARKYRFH